MKKSSFNGQTLDQMVQRLPGGQARMDALQRGIQQADEAEDHYWRLMFRYEYACEATFRDDPPKAIPVAAEFGAIFEEHSDVLFARSQDGAAEMYLMITQMGIDPIVCLPQISRQQWEEMMDGFYQLVKRYHLGLRTYWRQMFNFWKYVDSKKAFEYFQKFWKTGRDGLSDCRACERSYAVEMCLMAGDRAAADEYAKPMEQGRIRFCSDTPQLYWLAYLEDALDRGDMKQAEELAIKLYRKGNRDKSDLSYLGAVLCCWAVTDLDRAVGLAEKRLHWALGMWDQKKVFDFYKGAWLCFRQLELRQQRVELALPVQFPLYQASGEYDCGELAQWFYREADAIARRFDQRNGSDWFSKKLALAGRLLK